LGREILGGSGQRRETAQAVHGFGVGLAFRISERDEIMNTRKGDIMTDAINIIEAPPIEWNEWKQKTTTKGDA
jgi:hypothetical protein